LRNALAITIDIEDWYHIPSVSGSPFSTYASIADFYSKWDGKYDYLSKPTYRILALLKKYNVKATFFVVASIVEKYPGLVESIVEDGHEIACHGLDHRCWIDPKTLQPLYKKSEFKHSMQEAKKILESVSNQSVIGYRAPNALISKWMITILDDLDFKYDSSLSFNSLYKKNDLTPNLSTAPYSPLKNCNILEFPWPYLSFFGFKFPSAGGPFLRFLGSNYIMLGLNQSFYNGPTLLYFHPIDISRESFPIIGKGRPLYWFIKGRIVEKRIIRIINYYRKRVELCTLRDISRELIV